MKERRVNFQAVEIHPKKPYAIYRRLTGQVVAEVTANNRTEAVETYLKEQDKDEG